MAQTSGEVFLRDKFSKQFYKNFIYEDEYHQRNVVEEKELETIDHFKPTQS